MRLTVRLLAIAAAVFFSSCEEKEAVQPGAGITSFSFLKENNPSLTEDVTCTVNEDGTITGTFNDRLSDYFLKASFELDAEYASVNGVVQQSGVSKNNYAKEVVYEVRLKDGTSMTQTVKMKCKPAPQVPVIRINTENG